MGENEKKSIENILLTELQPTQFYLSEEKIGNIKKWFNAADLSGFEPLPVKFLNGKFILTDGHSRAWVAFCAGLVKLPLIWESEDLDWKAYGKCVDACVARGVNSISDFAGRILSKEDYKIQWNGWCDDLHAMLRKTEKTDER